MAATHIHPHHPLPAPAVHTGFSVPQSKSRVLAGVQDAYWSDDEADDAECPLCLEEMDISDLNFKPCVCGYQICRFCWHHIKENLNKRCPACRRIYTDEGVEFKPINKEDHKRLMHQKKQRERERKDLDALGRRHLANVRVVQRNVVYVIGIGPRFAREELIPTLRSEDYFGKYGRISKILLVKRTSPGGGEPIVGLYITYHRREDAARAISAVDGAASPSGGREVMRASYGTTKYCMAFLRGVNCNDKNCMNLHEWGDEKDCFTKEDLTTLKHTIKQTETRSRGTTKKVEEHDVGLPRGASWAAQKGVASGHSTQSTSQGSVFSATNRQGRRGASARHVRGSTGCAQVSTGETRSTFTKALDKKIVVSTTAKPPSQASSSRPATPASAMSAHRPGTPPDVKTMRTKRNSPYILHSPAHSTTADSDHWSSSQDIPSSAVPSTPAEAIESMPPTPIVPPGLAVVPSGLSAPPGIPMPSRPPRVESASPQTPLLSSQTTYQMSNAARALIDDIKARREAVPSSIINPSPFPDIDRTLQTLSGGDGGGFSFNLDPKLAHGGKDFENHLSNFEDEATPFQSNYMASFPLQTVPPHHSGAFAPPGLSYTAYQDSPTFDSTSAHRPGMVSMERQSSNTSSYIGSFNPFSDFSDDVIVSSPTQNNPADDIGRKVSRFGFARGRQGSANTPSPLHISLTTSANINENPAVCGSADSYQGSQSWSLSAHQEYPYSHPSSAMGSPHVQLAQLHSVHSSQSPTLLQPYDSPETSHTSLSEAQLREFIQSSRDRANVVGGPPNTKIEQNNFVRLPFNDPAIMSASLGIHDNNLAVYSDSPNLVLPSTPAHNASISSTHLNETRKFSNTRSPSDEVPESNLEPPNTLSTIDFPALTASTPDDQSLSGDGASGQQGIKARKKAERNAAKKAVDTERAADRQRIAQERAILKAAERAKAAQEKERLAALKEEQQRLEKEKAQREKAKEGERAVVAREAQLEKGKASAPAATRSDGKKAKGPDGQKVAKRLDVMAATQKSGGHVSTSRAQQSSVVPVPIVEPAPLLSKKPKKSKPVGNAKLVRLAKEGEQTSEDITPPAPSPLDVHPMSTVNLNIAPHRSQNVDRNSPTPLEEIFDELDLCYPWLDLNNHPFFDLNKVNPAARMPLEYGPLVHALSALSVGGGSFANNMPSGSIDNAVSSFQQLLETLTQTISDLLRLLPRTTWDDSSSFDGVLRDMLRGDDFLDDAGDEGQNKDDEVAALTLALERRARWMEVQLSKLEELHRDINLAAVRAILSFNDNGWDRSGFLPRVGNTLKRYDSIGMVEEGGSLRPMTTDELEKKVMVLKEAAIFAETEVKEAMVKMQSYKPLLDYY